jgi:Aspartyl protease
MPHLTHDISSDGFALTVLIGRNGRDTAALVNARQPVPAPVTVRAIIDSGADISCIAPRVAQQLGLPVIGQVQTQTVGGPVNARLFEVGLSIPRAGNLMGPVLVLDQLHVMELTHSVPNIEMLIGKDVLLQCLLISDGPRGKFTIGD